MASEREESTTIGGSATSALTEVGCKKQFPAVLSADLDGGATADDLGDSSSQGAYISSLNPDNTSKVKAVI